MTREQYKDTCKAFLTSLENGGISKLQIRHIKFCLHGVENVEFGGVNKRHNGNKITDVTPYKK